MLTACPLGQLLVAQPDACHTAACSRSRGRSISHVASFPSARRRNAALLRCRASRRGTDGSEHPFATEGTPFAPGAESTPDSLLAALTALRARRAGNNSDANGPGQVHLVGTGPGSPELLTLQALRLMQTADVVLYDRLVSPEILELVHPGARLVYVGKAAGFHTRTQEEIHTLLQEFADAGATVVRLKGGDPLVFGRGGEECDFLRARGVPVAVAPGITAASGIAAELGVPLTHRGVASSVRFITGHSREGGEEPSEADVTSFSPADTHATLVIYMGLGTLPSLASALLEAGLPPTTPALAVERGTTAVQRRLFGRLAGIATATQTHGMRSPTLVFIGNCVALSPLWPWPGSDGNDAGADISDARLQIGTPSLVPAAQPSRVVLPDGQVITLPPASKALRADTRAT